MTMTKRVFLLVTGEDYSAMTFSQECNAQDFYESMVQDEVTEREFEEATVTIKEFGAVDDAFIQFIRDEILDEDHSKDTDFFEVNPV